MNRHVLELFILIILALFLVPSCSQTTRYRVLSFFFDGVPPPGSVYSIEDGQGTDRDEQAMVTDRNAPAEDKPLVYLHTPYRERRCSGCHDMAKGKLVRSPEDGLCASCHEDVPGESAYVHGPVAVGACLECHHFHESQYPGLLLMEAKALCLQCHPSEDLLQGEHHVTIESVSEGSCIDCHDPHGGSDGLFLKRSER